MPFLKLAAGDLTEDQLAEWIAVTADLPTHQHARRHGHC